MRVVCSALFIFLLASSSANAVLFSGVGICNSYSGDNGCSLSRTYASSPAFRDTNFAYDSAQSGQLPSSPSAGQIATRNSLLHENNFNIPYIDYPIGSNAPSTLTPISSFAGDHICSAVHAAGDSVTNPMGGGPYILCQADSTTSGTPTETISGYDFTNTGLGTGTDCVVVIEKNSTYSQPTINFINDYFAANYDQNVSPSYNYCWSGAANSAGVTAPGSVGTLIYLENGGGTGTAPHVGFYNDTFDGNFAISPGATWARLYAITDARGIQDNVLIYYSVFQNLGVGPISGTGSGTSTPSPQVYYSADLNSALSGQSLAHGEFALYTGNSVTRDDIFVGDIFYTPSSQSNVQNTTAFYLSGGLPTDVTFSSTIVSNNVVVTNSTNCGNAGPYSPNNQCSGGTTSTGYALFDLQDANSFGTSTFTGNIVDGTSTNDCYGNPYTNTINGNTAPNLAASVTQTSGPPVITITHQVDGYTIGPPPVRVWRVGMNVYDSNLADGFTTTYISSYGTYVLSTGLGTVNLAASSEPSTASQDSWRLSANLLSNTWNTNWSIGGSGLTARALTFAGQPFPAVACP